jgi:hypothetical protein
VCIYIYITRRASNEIFSTSNKIQREVLQAKDLSATRGVSLPNVSPSAFHFQLLPHTVSTDLLGVAETRHSFTPHLQASNLGKLSRAQNFWPVYPLLFFISKTFDLKRKIIINMHYIFLVLTKFIPSSFGTDSCLVR